ncbi:glycosyltransferase [Haloferax prahovense]|uniref:glycosyltransferase n=1 Tax=Haloferax prahovense TaxID=381852 RepID=UPI003C74A2B2
MSIGIVTEPDWGLGGIGVFGEEVCSRLLRREGTVRIEVDRNGVRSLPFPSVLTYGKRWLVGSKLRDRIAASDAAVVFLPDHRYLTFDPGSVPQTVVPYVHDILPVTTLFSDVPSTLFARLYTRRLSALDAAICASRFTASDLRLRTPFDGETPVVYQGVDQLPSNPEETFEYDLVYVGSTIDRKNPAFLSDCFAAAEEAGFSCAAVTDRDAELPGDRFSEVSAESLGALLAGARFYLHPSKQEGFGRPPVEAQQLGTPVVGLRTPINEEVLGEPSEAWLPIETPTDLVEVLRGDGVDYEALEARSAENAARFSWETTADEIFDVLERYR